MGSASPKATLDGRPVDEAPLGFSDLTDVAPLEPNHHDHCFGIRHTRALKMFVSPFTPRKTAL